MPVKLCRKYLTYANSFSYAVSVVFEIRVKVEVLQFVTNGGAESSSLVYTL